MSKQFSIPASECAGIAQAFDNLKASEIPLQIAQARYDTALARYQAICQKMGRIYGFNPENDGDNWETQKDGSILVTLKDIPQAPEEPKAPELALVKEAPKEEFGFPQAEVLTAEATA